MNALRKFRSARLGTQLFLAIIVLLVIWMLWPDEDNRKELHPPRLTAAASEQCLELRPIFGAYQEAVIGEPGTYCVTTDFWQQRLSDGAGHSGPAPYRHLIAVGASNVTIDLMNHILYSDGHSSGIIVTVGEENETTKSSSLHMGRSKNITIKNGVIDLRGLGTAVASGASLFNFWVEVL